MIDQQNTERPSYGILTERVTFFHRSEILAWFTHEAGTLVLVYTSAQIITLHDSSDYWTSGPSVLDRVRYLSPLEVLAHTAVTEPSQ